MIINEFRNEYSFLSNFQPCSITIVGVSYKSVEAAYQASKTLDIDMRKQFSSLDPKAAKAKGKTLPLRANWNDVLKIECMELCLRAKFTIPELQRRLISTAPLELIEGNAWGDKFWGVCNGSGRNVLGKLLMMLRDDYIYYKEEPIENNAVLIPF